MINTERYRFRMILPAFSHFSIYTTVAKQMTSLGPLYIATSANKLDEWDAEVIDENNCKNPFCPKDREGYPDHAKLQQERPADVVGFYGSISSTIPRLFKIAQLYRKMGVRTVAGGKHVENLPEESLSNGLDAVVIGEGEFTIRELLLAWQTDRPLEHIAGIVFMKDGEVHRTGIRPPIENLDTLPYPDFNLLRYAQIKYYPFGRIRGCNMNCEFCAVKDRTRYFSPKRTINQIAHLVETQAAKRFFDCSDHFAADREAAIEFCKLLAEYRKRKKIWLNMTVQTRINDAEDPRLLQAMKKAGIHQLAIGYESPIDEDLKTMRKGYLSKDMVRWTDTLHEYGFHIHGMFIFGYPKKEKYDYQIPLNERVKKFRDFLIKAKIDTVQVVLTVPLPGTELRERLQQAGRLYSLDQIGWEYYDGQFPLYEPDDGVSPEDLQRAMTQIMGRFYRLQNLLNIVVGTLIHFPRMVFLASLSIVTFRVKYIVKAFLKWKSRYFRNDLIRFGGYLVLKSWLKKFKKDKFLQYLKRARQQLRHTGRNVQSGLNRPEYTSK
jgi:radical SAM superfamily enzyme YgiQ (UPF0313 family)